MRSEIVRKDVRTLDGAPLRLTFLGVDLEPDRTSRRAREEARRFVVTMETAGRTVEMFSDDLAALIGEGITSGIREAGGAYRGNGRNGSPVAPA